MSSKFGPLDATAARSACSLLTPLEMQTADRLTIATGEVDGSTLMERAGAAVARAATAAMAAMARQNGAVAVLAGPGSNGGDAYVAARLLAERGCAVEVFALGRDSLTGDAAAAARRWTKTVRDLADFAPTGFGLVVDGLFGAGLSRPLDGTAATAVRALNAAEVTVLAIDLPSGISGDTGQAMGEAVEAERTVTFFRRKPGHLLFPGRAHCGAVEVVDIGIAASVLDRIHPQTFANAPALWSAALRIPGRTGHKYDRGHAGVFSGGASTTGAARLSASAGLRAGAGLVTLFSPASALLVNAAHLTAVMLRRCTDAADLAAHLEDTRLNAFVLGPGFGVGETARCYAEAVLKAGRALVLDADGITSFAEAPDRLFAAAQPDRLVLTPHAGEFKRLFPDVAADASTGKPDKARAAAARSGATVVLKGADTVIASPDGRAAINATGSAWLATAGSGDVLSGIVCGLLAQGVPAFEAAAAGVWMHGRAAELFGPGLIAEDLPGMLPRVWAEIEATTP